MKTKIFFLIFFSLFIALPPAQAKENTAVAAPPKRPKINLVWQIISPNVNTDFTKLPPVQGVNVVSPCWFDVVTAHGLLRNKMPHENAVTELHAKGYKVWPLVTNSFDPQLTHLLLENPEGQKNLQEYLLALAEKYSFDGYNFDFENIADSDRHSFTALIRKITPGLRERGLTISLDVTTPSNTPYWSLCYDRGALAKEVDYLMIMAYDQHHPAMGKAGSTAALNWVEEKLQATLKDVAKDKIILGLPLYTRIWKSAGNTSTTKGRTISMPATEELISQENIIPVWQKDLGQNYLSYTKENKTYQIWQENATSLKAKVNLVHKYQLAGIASWRKGFETPDVWSALDEELQKKN